MVLAVGIGAALEALTPNIDVAIEPMSVGRTGVIAALAAMVAAVIPLRRVVRIDPASSVRRSS